MLISLRSITWNNVSLEIILRLMLQLDYIKISEVSMKPLEPGCLAIIIKGMSVGQVVTVLRYMAAGARADWFVKSDGITFTCESTCNGPGNWLIEGVPGAFIRGKRPDVCAVSAGSVVGSAIFDQEYLMRIDGFDSEEHQTKTSNLLLQE